jgi:hypothetical protein
MSGQTPGVAVGETVELNFGLGGDLFQPNFHYDNMAFTVTVTGIARGMISGTYRVQSFRQTFCVITDLGTSTIVAVGAMEQIGSTQAASWTLTGSISASPYDHFKVAFFTGTTQSLVRVTAKVETVDVYNPL